MRFDKTVMSFIKMSVRKPSFCYHVYPIYLHKKCLRLSLDCTCSTLHLRYPQRMIKKSENEKILIDEKSLRGNRTSNSNQSQTNFDLT